MFDKLIASDSQGADFKNRSRYFIVSSVVVGCLFLSAVVFSLYAADIGLGNDEFELSAILAPSPAEEPEPKQPRQPRPQAANEKNELPTRPTNMMRVDEVPTKMPTTISSIPSSDMTRPVGRFLVTPGLGSNGTGGPETSERGDTPGGTSASDSTVSESEITKELPPPIRPRIDAPRPPRSIGVVNGLAKYLPKPPYSAAAIAMRAEGNVSVQITIDESGKVISSKAVSGHPMLKGAAETAAWNARFTPTLLSNVPVKVTGVIVYKFSRN